MHNIILDELFNMIEVVPKNKYVPIIHIYLYIHTYIQQASITLSPFRVFLFSVLLCCFLHFAIAIFIPILPLCFRYSTDTSDFGGFI